LKKIEAHYAALDYMQNTVNCRFAGFLNLRCVNRAGWNLPNGERGAPKKMASLVRLAQR
jgi:hypothetical protein